MNRALIPVMLTVAQAWGLSFLEGRLAIFIATPTFWPSLPGFHGLVEFFFYRRTPSSDFLFSVPIPLLVFTNLQGSISARLLIKPHQLIVRCRRCLLPLSKHFPYCAFASSKLVGGQCGNDVRLLPQRHWSLPSLANWPYSPASILAELT